MHISKASIRNFRNFRNTAFHFRKGVNTLIGENGSGKTNAFYAIRLLIDDSLSRRSIKLKESDFNRALGAWKGHWIIISLDFDELDASEGCQVIRHSVGHMTTENKGTYTFIYRPKKEVRQKLFKMSENGDDDGDIDSYLESITIDQYEGIFTGRASIDFCDDETYTRIVGSFDDYDFPDPNEEDTNEIGVSCPQLHYEVSCTFAKALRDVVSDLRSYRDNPLLGLLRGTEKEIEVGEAQKIIDGVISLNEDIAGLDEIIKIAGGIQNTLYKTVGHTYSPSVDIKSALPEDIEKLLQRLSLKVGDALDGGYQGDITELSLGAANLIFLSLKMLEYEYKLSTDRVAHFLFIEEPEAHIHTHIQMTLFEKYVHDRTQVIVSTHSTHVSSASKIRSVNILTKDIQEARVFQPSNGLSDPECERIERYLDAVRSTLLFAKGVMVVEGDAEQILIPNLVKIVLGISLDELGVSLINMSTAFFDNIIKIFHSDRIHRPCAIITDLDESIFDLPDDPREDDDEEKKSRNSEIAGKERKEKLDSFCEGNDFVEPFYADHTFEVDFLMSGNAPEVVRILRNVYQQEKAIKSSKDKLKAKGVAVAGKEVLRLAEKVGKGWFALMITEQVDEATYIPDYILEALAFASHKTITDSTLRLMGIYRIRECHRYDNDYEKLYKELPELDKLSSKEFIEKYMDELPKDELTFYIKHIESFL